MKVFWTIITFACLISTEYAWGNADKHATPPEGMPASMALKKLQEGHRRFLASSFSMEGKNTQTRRKLVNGQAPHTIVLSCSDSRVPPELVFDQGLGDLFTIRVAGQALDSSVIASIEYAVSHLGTRHIFVLGHTSCGAVKAALASKKDVSSGSPSLDKLVADIRPRIDRGPAAISSKNVSIESSQNARQVAEDLVSRSVIIAEAIREGRLEINSGLYHLETGKVDFD